MMKITEINKENLATENLSEPSNQQIIQGLKLVIT